VQPHQDDPLPARRRVLLVIAGLPAGGAERQMSLLARSLDRARYDVGLLIFNAREKIHYSDAFDAPLWFGALGQSGRPTPILLWNLLIGIRSAVRTFGPDIVHATLNTANHAVRLSSLLLGWRIPIVTSVRADFRQSYKPQERRLEQLLWRRSAAIICNSPSVARQMRADLGIPESRIVSVANGIDSAFFDTTPTDRPAGWPSGPVALVVGRFSGVKNHLALVAALARLDRERALGPWRFIFLGEGPLQLEIQAAVSAAHLADRITLWPPVLDTRPFYRHAQLLIMPSLVEGMPNAALEAQASACPVAISAAANGAGVVADHAGWVLDASMDRDLASILAMPLEGLAEVGRRARTRVSAMYSVEAMVRSTESVYDHVLAKAR
jgi:glycosyltransferase involved in cell wall biosynthesis